MMNSVTWRSGKMTLAMMLCTALLISCLILSNVAPAGSTATQPPSCTLTQSKEDLKADCRHLGLSQVPTHLPSEVTSLNLGNNNIHVLQNGSLQHLPRLNKLLLPQNHLRLLEAGVFRGLPELQQVSLSRNDITELHPDLFADNHNVNILDLSHNRLQACPISVFPSLRNLNVLTLAYNNIQKLNFTGFSSENISSLVLVSLNISYIREEVFHPLQEKSIQVLSLRYNNLTTLDNYTFTHLRYVQQLELYKNHIQVFSVMPFLGMTSLEKIDLRLNNISEIIPIDNYTIIAQHEGLPKLKTLLLFGNRIKTIPSKAFIGLENLDYLDLHQCRTVYLKNDSFDGLTSLQRLSLVNNQIKVIPNKIFTTLPHLQTLMLSGNKLKTFDAEQLGGIASLKSLDLGHNSIETISRHIWDLPALEFLDLTQNSIVRLEHGFLNVLPSLTNLTLAKNNIMTVKNNAFRGLEQLTSLDMSSMGQLGSFTQPFANLGQLSDLDLSHTVIRPNFETFVGLNSLRKLNMKYTSLKAEGAWDVLHNATSFSHLPELQEIRLGGNSLDAMYPGTFMYLNKLKILWLDHCSIQNLHPDIFQNLSSLVYLYINHNDIVNFLPQHIQGLSSLVGVKLQNNNIKKIDKHLFSMNTHFSYLYMSHNALTTIADGTTLPKHYLDISNNAMLCDCNLAWFRKQVDLNNMTLLKSSETICSTASLSPLKGQPILNFDPHYLCGPNIALYISTSFLIIAFIIGMSVAYKKRWWLSYKCFHLKLLVLGYEEFTDGREHTDYEYDLNIIYHEPDEDWVRDTLRPGIEECLPDFNRIVQGDDNLPLGMYYMDAIIHVLENSFKTVLVVSHTAVTNHYFITKVRHALEQMNEEEMEKALLVFIDDIPDHQLPYLLRLFLSQNQPYLLWNEDKYGQKLFWDKLAKNIKVNRKMNDLLPI